MYLIYPPSLYHSVICSNVADFFMRYTKQPLSFEQQADLLITRGLETNKSVLIKFLKQVNYYRLSGYIYPFKKSPDEEVFVKGTTLETIKERYSFDSQMRLLLFNAIEKIEISILRTQLVEHLTVENGTFCYTDKGIFKDKTHFPETFHEDFLRFSEELLEDKETDYIGRFKGKYQDNKFLPFWIVVEKTTFGQMAIFYGNLQRKDRLAIAKKYLVSYSLLGSWLHALSFLRNACAHHERLWNRYMPIRPSIPKEANLPEFHNPIKIDKLNPKLFRFLVVIQYLLNFIDTENLFGGNLLNLIKSYPNLPLEEIGFPKNWENIPFWKGLDN